MKNTHVQMFELIEESFDSNSWICVTSLRIDDMLRECFLSCYAFAYICCACDLMVQSEV
jgi:hypothetical protein